MWWTKLALGPESQPADLRMQPVGADHLVEPAGLGVGELDAHSAWVLMDLDDRVVPQELGNIVAGLEQGRGEIRAWELHLDPVRHLEGPQRDPTDPLVRGIDEAQVREVRRGGA